MASQKTSDSASRPAGRPRDPDIDEAVLEAARQVFLEKGWGRFSFDAIARVAGVGKPAIYRRWATREALVVDCLVTAQPPMAGDTGSFRGDLLDLAYQHADWWLLGDGQLNQRVMTERLANKELWDLLDREYIGDRITAARQMTIRAIERGEVLTGTSPSMVAELLVSPISTHFNFTTHERRAALHRDFHRYAEVLANTIVRAVGVVPNPKTRARGKAESKSAMKSVAKKTIPIVKDASERPAMRTACRTKDTTQKKTLTIATDAPRRASAKTIPQTKKRKSNTRA